ncbi:MAG: hypothetical protein Q9160_000006 [Pyrenula sp. 1 TL-2023]
MADVTDPTHDTVNGLFDESDDEDPFRDFDFDLDDRTSRKRKADSDKENGDLGVDEQIKITKKRKPMAKLDENRLLSDQGISKLKKSYKVKLQGRFKGKGFEFADAEKLLNFFQLWLDNLFPKAKFADGLTMVEKVGHSKRMQIMRRTWIDEGKPKPDYVDDKGDELRPADRTEDTNRTEAPTGGREAQPSVFKDGQAKSIFGNGAESLFVPEKQTRPTTDSDIPEEDDLDALLAETSAPIPNASKRSQPAAADSEGEDDLDALLAEYDNRRPGQKPTDEKRQEPRTEEGVDDLDALLAEQDIQTESSSKNMHENEADDLDAFLAEQDMQETSSSENVPEKRNGQEDGQDDLDSLLAEQDEKEDQNTKPIASQRSQSDQDDLEALNRANNDWIESL